MRALLNAASVPVHASGTPYRSIGDLFSWLALLALATLAALARRSRAHPCAGAIKQRRIAGQGRAT
jgi:MYXO-CTERM domain-containing protein